MSVNSIRSPVFILDGRYVGNLVARRHAHQTFPKQARASGRGLWHELARRNKSAGRCQSGILPQGSRSDDAVLREPKWGVKIGRGQSGIGRRMVGGWHRRRECICWETISHPRSRPAMPVRKRRIFQFGVRERAKRIRPSSLGSDGFGVLEGRCQCWTS